MGYLELLKYVECKRLPKQFEEFLSKQRGWRVYKDEVLFSIIYDHDKGYLFNIEIHIPYEASYNIKLTKEELMSYFELS